jgi:hypothetical protein
LYLVCGAQDKAFDYCEEDIGGGELVAYELRALRVGCGRGHEGEVGFRVPMKLVCAAESEARLEIKVPYSIDGRDTGDFLRRATTGSCAWSASYIGVVLVFLIWLMSLAGQKCGDVLIGGIRALPKSTAGTELLLL